MLRSDLLDNSDAYIVAKGRINGRAVANIDINEKMLHLQIMHCLSHA